MEHSPEGLAAGGSQREKRGVEEGGWGASKKQPTPEEYHANLPVFIQWHSKAGGCWHQGNLLIVPRVPRAHPRREGHTRSAVGHIILWSIFFLVNIHVLSDFSWEYLSAKL
jgi:hypothetical protein